MKQIIVKLVIFLPILLFIDWIIMIVIGCISNICISNVIFFSTIYSYFGVALLVVSLLFLALILYDTFDVDRNRTKIPH